MKELCDHCGDYKAKRLCSTVYAQGETEKFSKLCDQCHDEVWGLHLVCQHLEGGSDLVTENLDAITGLSNPPKQAGTTPSTDLAEQLHIWYLEAVQYLEPENYNPNAQKRYSELTEGQKSIDQYIATKVEALISQERNKAIAEYQRDYEQKHIASAVQLKGKGG